MSKPVWFLDWSGLSCAIIASGPSVRKADVQALEGRIKVIAIKRNVELAPFADAVYGCDAAWWRNSSGLPRYRGLKVSATPRGLSEGYPDIRFVQVEAHLDRILTLTPGVIGSGGNSGFQALNLAIQFGATRILLIGFDAGAKLSTRVHWYGRNSGTGQSNPDELNFRRWRKAFEDASEDLDRLGVVVINASDETALTCFARASVADALEAWGG